MDQRPRTRDSRFGRASFAFVAASASEWLRRFWSFVAASASEWPSLPRAGLPSLTLAPTPLLKTTRSRLVALLFAGFAVSLHAATPTVDSLPALQRAIDRAEPGDIITLKDGVYQTTAPIAITRRASEGHPITITAETVGGVEIRGKAGFAVNRPAAWIIVRGFRLTHASGRNIIAAGTQHVRFSRNTFACAGEGAYLMVTGDDAEVDHNEFRDKHTLGNMVSVTGVGAQVARRLWIHHNYFHDFANAHGNGAETIRFGLSGLSMSNGDGLVEHNLFVHCTGENELISNKSCRNTYRYNTFLDSPGTQLTLRHGNECLVYGNIFRRLDGLRIFGDRHLIFSNYFEDNTRGINLGNGDGEVADGAKLTCHDRPDNCTIVFNTLVNNREHFQMDHRTGGNPGLGATHTTFAYNLIQGGGRAAKIGGPNPGAAWRGNLLWKTDGAGDMPPSGYVSADPLLQRDTLGILRVPPGSPAVARATEPFPKVTVDQDGQPRPAARTVGADEPGEAPVVGHLLTVHDVGPAAP